MIGGGVTKINPGSGIPYSQVPAYLLGSESLIQQLDQHVLVLLRVGKNLIRVCWFFYLFCYCAVTKISWFRCTTGTCYSQTPIFFFSLQTVFFPLVFFFCVCGKWWYCVRKGFFVLFGWLFVAVLYFE